MLRAMTYTVLFCGLSAGGAVALALAHSSSPFETTEQPAIAAPNYFEAAPIQISRAEPAADLPMPAPVLTAPEPAAPVAVEVETPEAPAPVVAPVAAPVKKVATPAAKPKPAPKKKVVAKARPAPKPAAQPIARPRVTVSTQGVGTWNGSTDFSNIQRAPIKRVAPQVSTQGQGAIDLSNTWMIGVYR